MGSAAVRPLRFLRARVRALCLLCGIIKIVFLCVYHSLIMRDVNYGWLIRYLHANTASFFFIFVYLHIGRGLYYGSYKSPRTLLWSIGVIILVLMMAIAFLGFNGQKWMYFYNIDITNVQYFSNEGERYSSYSEYTSTIYSR